MSEFVINKNNKSPSDYPTTTKLYGWKTTKDEEGFPSVSQETKALAKLINKNIVYKYYVAINRFGLLYNPLVDDLNQFELIESNKYCFEYYRQFLQTENILYHTKAEREM